MHKRKKIGVILLALLLGLTTIPTKQVCAENQEVDVKGEIILSTDELILDESDAPDYCGQVDVTVVLEGDYSDIYNAVILPYQCDRGEDGQLLMYCDSEKSTSSKTIYTAPMYFGTQIKASTYTFNQVELLRWSDSGRDVTRFAERSFVFDKQFQDKEAPQLVSVSINKQGQTVSGRDIEVTIKVQDNGELRDAPCNEVLIDSPMGDDEYYHISRLNYQGDGIYTADISMWRFNYEWYIRGFQIYDVAGNCCLVEFDQTSPYYFYVEYDGVCNKIIFEDLNVNLYDNEGKLMTTIVKDFERRSTIGDVLGTEYLNGSKQDAGEFLGWSTQPNGTIMDKNVQFLTGYKEMITSVDLYEVYEETEGEKVPEDTTKPGDTTKPEDTTKPGEDKKTAETVQQETQSVVEQIVAGTVADSVVDEKTAEKVTEAMNNGKSVTSEIVVKEVEPNEIAQDEKNAIEEKVTAELGADAKVQYFDVSIVLKAGDEELGTLNELQEEITITVAIPDELKAESRVYKVIRNHNGEITVLDTIVNEDGTISFKTDRFSTYAIAYADKEETNTNPNLGTPSTDNNKDTNTNTNTNTNQSNKTPSTDSKVPQTGDNSSVMLYVTICLVALAAVVVTKKRNVFAKART